MFGLTNSLFSTNTNQTLPDNHQQQIDEYTKQRQTYVDNIRNRTEQLNNFLLNNCSSLISFTYDLDLKNAEARNNQLEAFCIQSTRDLGCIDTDKPTDEVSFSAKKQSAELLAKLNKAKLENPNPSICAIIVVRGVDGLIHRINSAAAAHEKINECYAGIEEVNKTLYSNSVELKDRLNNVQSRHISLTHQFIRVVDLLEECALLTGSAQTNTQHRLKNESIMSELQNTYNLGKWQSRVNQLRSQIRAFSLHLNYSNDSSTDEKYTLDPKRERIFFDLLNHTSIMIDFHRESLEGIEGKLKELEDSSKLVKHKKIK